jgi:dihydropyrimidinase
MASLAIVNGVIVKASGRTRATILMDEGKIQAVLSPHERPSAEVTIDAEGRNIIPGVIDAHVHLGISQDFESSCWSESRAAVTGGVTTMIHYLLSPDSYFDVYDSHVKAVEKNSLIDVAFHGLVQNEKQIEEIPRTIDELGMTSYKFHMAMKGVEAGYGIKGVDDGMMFEGMMQVASRKGVLALAHAENIDVILRFRERMVRENPDSKDLSLWRKYRPAFTEEEAIVRCARLAEAAGVPFGVIHNSVGTGPHLLAEARIRYPHLYMETCPQFLMLNADMPLGTIGKMNPPLRSNSDSEALWAAIANRQIDWMGSDHCDYDEASKKGSIWEAGPGLVSGVQMILPTLLNGVNEGRISLERLVEVTSSNTAKIFGFSPQKGTLDVGCDADLVILDMDREVTINAEILNGFSPFTPYDGIKVKGWARTTIGGGQVLYDQGQVNDLTNHRGKIIRQDRNNPPVL